MKNRAEVFEKFRAYRRNNEWI